MSGEERWKKAVEDFYRSKFLAGIYGQISASATFFALSFLVSDELQAVLLLCTAFFGGFGLLNLLLLKLGLYRRSRVKIENGKIKFGVWELPRVINVKARNKIFTRLQRRIIIGENECREPMYWIEGIPVFVPAHVLYIAKNMGYMIVGNFRPEDLAEPKPIDPIRCGVVGGIFFAVLGFLMMWLFINPVVREFVQSAFHSAVKSMIQTFVKMT